MESLYLCIKLMSDTSFSMGDGLAGEVDSEIQYDEVGCPYMNGRSLKGILVNECADILDALPLENKKSWEVVAANLFGTPGTTESNNSFRFGNVQIPSDLRIQLINELAKRLQEAKKYESNYTSASERSIIHNFQMEILNSLTEIRTQTAIDSDGIAKDHSLRSIRVILRETPFEGLISLQTSNDLLQEKRLLAACVKSFQRAGSHRNRGLGRLTAWLEDTSRRNISDELIDEFLKEISS